MPIVAELIDSLKSLNQNKVIAYAVWSTADVLSRSKDIGCKITRRAAEDIIEEVHHRQDCSIGINWDVLDNYIIDHRKT